MKVKLLLAAVITLSLSALAQTNSQTITTLEPLVPAPTFHVTVVSRSVQAVNYQHRSGATKLNFAGTSLMLAAHGQAKVESKKGYLEIQVEFANFNRPTAFGGEYLTYVLWAISPEGRAQNLGEILVGNNHRSKLDVTTDLQAFALVVTAEPYYAVREPSNVVVLENIVRADTKGTTEALSAKHDFLERGGYIPTGYKFDPVILNAKLPLEFFEARNAVRIAQSEGAEQYASASYGHSVELMNNTDELATKNHIDRKPLIAVARETVQTAEDSRAIAVKKIDEQRQASALQASADAQVKAQDQTNDALRQKEQAQSDMAANIAATQAAMASNQAASAAAVSAAQADSEQSRLAAQQAQQSAQRSESDKTAMRARLSEQLNTILQTRDTARGLIVNMSDVLFDTGRYSLKPGAREKLAKVAGILLAYPGLSIAVGGYTDNVGSDKMNQTLSESRASTVRDYLVEQGVAADSVSARGFGNTLPVASNNNSAGRQQNRRVELLVSGDAIGNPANATTGSLQ